MWELGHKESWVLKNWCFWTVVLEKTLESPLTARRSNQSMLNEINPEYSLKDWCWSWSSNTLANWCELPGKDPDAGKDQRQEEKGTREDELVRWHYRLNVHELEEAPGDGEGQGSLACCRPWIRKESDVPEWLNNSSKCWHEEILSSALILKTCSSWHASFYTEKLSVKHNLHGSFIFAHVLLTQYYSMYNNSELFLILFSLWNKSFAMNLYFPTLKYFFFLCLINIEIYKCLYFVFYLKCISSYFHFPRVYTWSPVFAYYLSNDLYLDYPCSFYVNITGFSLRNTVQSCCNKEYLWHLETWQDVKWTPGQQKLVRTSDVETYRKHAG